MFESEDQEITAYLRSNLADANVAPKEAGKAKELEDQGWRVWLMTLMPFRFESEFSADHVKFWDLHWSVIFRIREQKKYKLLGLPLPEQFIILDREYAVLLILGRALAKSSSMEAAAAMRGAILGEIYCLYLCETADQSQEHVGNIRSLIDHDDSRVSEFYPHMLVDPNAIVNGKRAKTRSDLFITSGGCIYRAKGLHSSLRGLNVNGKRPDMIIGDDFDNVNDSIAVSMSKLKDLTSSVMPTQGHNWTQIMIGQNLIGETTVVSMINTGQSDAMSERTTIGVSNTFEHFRLNREYRTYMNEEDGRIRHEILPAAVPTWSGVSIAQAQKFLNDSGLETFLAEYMNSFAHLKNEKVFEFDEKRHLITWDMFEAMFGVRHIPGHWRGKVAADLGYSKESLSAWGFYARSAQNSKLPGRYFGYRSKTFTLDGIDDQAIDIWKDLFPDPETGKKHFEATQRFADYPELFRVLNLDDKCSRFLKRFDYDSVADKYKLKPLDLLKLDEISDEEKALFYVKQANKTFKSQIQSWVISHEKTGEQKTLAKMYGIPATKVKRFEADAGVAEANHLLRGDYTQPHPFYPDEIVPETGLYRLGSPYIFFIVRRIQAAEDDRDMKVFREQVGAQRWTQEKLGELGLTKTIPMKYRSDHCDQLRMFATDYALPESTPKTIAEEVEHRIPEKHRVEAGQILTVEEQMSAEVARAFAEEQTKRELGLVDEDDEDYEI